MSKRTALILGLNALFLLGLVLLLRTLDGDALRSYISSANVPILLFGIALYLVSVVVKVGRLRAVIGHFGHQCSYRDAAVIQLIGIALALITPGRVGEAAKIYFLRRRDVPVWRGTVMIVFERLFDLALLSIVGAFFAVSVETHLVTSVLTGIAVVAVGALFFFQKLYRIEHLIPSKFRTLTQTIQQMEVRRPWSSAGTISLLTIMSWGLEASFAVMVFAAIGVHVSIVQAFGILAVSTLAGILSFLPSGIGAFELSAVYLYGLVGVAEEAATLTIVFTRVVSILLPIVAALIVVNVMRTSLRDLRRSIRASRDDAEA